MGPYRAATDFGSRLREARERRGLTLRQIAHATKISIHTLEALERNEVARLPGGIFSRAFVRAYAIEVGLDPEETIEQFMGQFPHDTVTVGHPTTAHVEDHDAVESDRRMASTVLWLILISVPVAGAVLYFGASGRPAPPPVEERSALAGARPPSAIEPTARDVASPVEAPAIATPQPATPSPVASAVASPAAGVVAAKAAPAGEVVRVHLAATKECWVSATVDGAKVVERLFQPGEQQALQVRRELVLTAGDAAALTWTVNGAAARPLGGDGEVATARLTPSNFKTFLSTP